ncbi:MAG: FtsX-like permease family protein [Bariatricus sp.]
MEHAYQKDIKRTIKKGKKRFCSIALIAALGVTMLCGLKAACVDLRHTADRFFDEQNLYDISIMSTLGLTEEDVQALRGMDGVKQVQGGVEKVVYTTVDNRQQDVDLKTLGNEGVNVPYIIEGRLPKKKGEVAVTEAYLEDSGKKIGDTLSFEETVGEDEEKTFAEGVYTITGTILDVLDINNSDGAVTFRSSVASEYTFFVTEDSIESDLYTVMYLTVDGARDLMCYSEEYENTVANVTERIESQIKEQREKARYDTVTGEALEELDEARLEMEEEFAKAEKELDDAAKELEKGENELRDGEKELKEQEETANREFEKAWEKIRSGYADIAAGLEKLSDSEEELREGEKQIQDAKAQLAEQKQETDAAFAEAERQIDDGIAQVREQKQAMESRLEEAEKQAAAIFGDAWPEEEWEALKNAFDDEAAKTAFENAIQPVMAAIVNQIDAQIAQLDPEKEEDARKIQELEEKKQNIEQLPGQLTAMTDGMKELFDAEAVLLAQKEALKEQKKAADFEFANAELLLQEKEAQIEQGKASLAEGKKELEAGQSELQAGEAELKMQEAEAKAKFADAKKELENGWLTVADGRIDLENGLKEYEEKRREALEELEEARQKIRDIDMTKWYIQDRTSLSGYANVKSDASAIEAIGTVFPIVFLIVAILISLTTITRMVEEDRGLIGTYKALGFTDAEIRRKYLLYALMACLIGGVLGDICGFVILPEIVFIIFRTMYTFPAYMLKFQFAYGIGGILLFIAGIAGAAYYACSHELKEMPAVLMRPQAPQQGSRILLERITLLWKRLSFLNKVTARNLFRYKKRLLMTTLGIMGCTALLLCGFVIKDSVTELMPGQYEKIYQYDLMAASSVEDNETLISYMKEEEDVKDYLNIRVENVKLKNESGGEESVQMIVVPDGEQLDGYINLVNTEGQRITLDTKGIAITQNASIILEMNEGENAAIQNMELEQSEAEISHVVKNYLGNNVYMTQSVYEKMFGEYEPNGVLANLSEACEDPVAVTDRIGAKEGVLSAAGTEKMKEEFSQAFALINLVVYVIIVLAASLAFVVLFTLSTTNISERGRELATIKVLGFYNKEVHLYVNKETIILTSIGIILGLPVGNVLGHLLTDALKMSSIYFEVSIHKVSYLIAAALAIGFALAVNLITDRSLDRIDPVEALKSVE